MGNDQSDGGFGDSAYRPIYGAHSYNDPGPGTGYEPGYDADYDDPAYASQLAPAAPAGPGPGPNPTRELPVSGYPGVTATGYLGYSDYSGYSGYPGPNTGRYAGPQRYGAPAASTRRSSAYGPPVRRPKSGASRWLWAIGVVVGVLVVSLATALIILRSAGQQNVTANPLTQYPRTTEPRTTLPTPPSYPSLPSMPSLPFPIPLPLPSQSTEPSTTYPPSTTGPYPPSTTTAPSQTVAYDVTGKGPVLNISYIDTGGVLQTEFNVMLPWHKQVQLTPSARRTASVTIVNFGREVTCSLTINGSMVQQHTGTGLTICTSMGGGLGH